MKTCVNCGVQLEDKDKFCPRCGTRCDSSQEAKDPYHQSYDDYTADTAPAVSGTNTGSSSKPVSPADQYPMKWHKFLMVIMIIGAVISFISGAGLFSGASYESQGVDADLIYRMYSGMKSCDMVYSVVLMAIGVFKIIVRNRLSRFRANGPESLKILYFISIGASLIYISWASSATRVNMLTSSNITSVFSSVLFLIINTSYYKKRSSLFVN